MAPTLPDDRAATAGARAVARSIMAVDRSGFYIVETERDDGIDPDLEERHGTWTDL